MASLNTSEFQFAFIFFAKFNELNNYRFNHVIVPNQNQEGNPHYSYNGTDIVLDEYFLQIKMPNFINWRRGNQNLPEIPYFKFKVYNSPKYNTGNGQLDFLKIHANDNLKKVYYVAPCFGSDYTCNVQNINFWCDSFYRSNPVDISNFVTFIDISSINDFWIEKNNKHHICYNYIGNAYFLSEAKEIKMKVPTILNEEDLFYVANEITIEEIIRQRKEEIISMTNINFFEINKIDINEVKLLDLQKIYLTFFNIFWIPILTPRTELTRMKLERIQNLIRKQ